MAQKTVFMNEIGGEVTFQKRKGAKAVRIRIGHDGIIRVTLPSWSPYKVAEAFVRSKADWITSQRVDRKHHIIGPNDRIGKGHRVRFQHETRANITSRVTKTELIIHLPSTAEITDDAVQVVTRAGAIRALKQESNLLLPQRIKTLAGQHGFSYRSLAVKRLQSRWGSCSSDKDIVLNCFLMQLPWDLIDYVLLHELVHTKVMAHGDKFWDELGKYVNDLPAKRKLIKQYQPQVIAQF